MKGSTEPATPKHLCHICCRCGTWYLYPAKGKELVDMVTRQVLNKEKGVVCCGHFLRECRRCGKGYVSQGEGSDTSKVIYPPGQRDDPWYRRHRGLRPSTPYLTSKSSWDPWPHPSGPKAG